MSTINDVYADGIASGWKLINAATLTESRTFEADVVIVAAAPVAAPPPKSWSKPA